MKFNKWMATCVILTAAINAHAGMAAPTAHSRANCGNNESITWFAFAEYNWRVVSFHNYNWNHPGQGYHYIDTGMAQTWRQAAVHWGESAPGGTYLVDGFHYFLYAGREWLDVNTRATDCSIYDGWWDV